MFFSMIKKTYRYSLVFACLFSVTVIHAEVLYMKDGQVLNGAIVNETKEAIWFKTKYKTSKVLRSNILRVMYGERKLEKIYILMRDNRVVDAYLVDQDNEKVTIRLDQNKPEENKILKKDIKQMSPKRILPTMPALSLRAGYFLPINTADGANLQPDFMYLAGIGTRFFLIPNSRVIIEAGYVMNTSVFTDVDGNERILSLQTIPALVSINYRLNFSKFKKKNRSKGDNTKGIIAAESGNTPAHRWDLIFRLGGGVSFMTFDNGEGEIFSGIKGTALAGIGISFEMAKSKFYVEIMNEFFYIPEETGSSIMAYMPSLRLAYRF